MLEYVLSERGKQKLKDNGYIYDKHIRHREKVYWICELRKTCRAKVHTSGENILLRIGTHSHAPSAAVVEKRVAYAAMKQAAMSTSGPCEAIVAASVEAMTASAISQLPGISSIKRTLRRCRAKASGSLSHPDGMIKVEVPQDYRCHEGGSPFLLFDSGTSDPERFLIFGSDAGLRRLKRCNRWFADSAFEPPSRFFYQVFSIGVAVEGEVRPVVHALMAKKSESAFTRVLEEIRGLAQGPNPAEVTVDFEPASIVSFCLTFRPAMHGSFLHFRRNMYRQICDSGLQQEYATDSDFAFECHLIAALAFVPPEDVVNAFVGLQVDSRLKSVINHVEKYYIGELTPEGATRKEPRFPIPFWNQYESFLGEDSMAKILVDEWHNNLQNFLSVSHFTLWKFLEKIRKDIAVNNSDFEHVLSDRPAAKKRKCAFEKVANKVKSYDKAQIPCYLRGIAHHISL